MTPSKFPWRPLAGISCALILAYPPASAGDAAAPDDAVIRTLAPRADLPPEADDPSRPKNTRLVPQSATIRRSYWTDDAGVAGANRIPYNAYRRSSFGTWSNFDETKANVYPLPELMVLKNGRSVTDAETWRRQRRPEILNDFLTEIYGRIPDGTPAISWEVTLGRGGDGARTKRILGHVDNSAYPDATPTIDLTLTLPAGASGPVPVMVVVTPLGGGNDPQRDAPGGPTPLQQVLSRGWGYAVFSATRLQPDNGAGLTGGIIGLMNRGRPRSRPDEWGALTAWAWGLSRAIDYLETDRDVDAKRLGVEGHSRWGKTALWAAALDRRWAIVYASCSGEGGAKILRRNYGETPNDLVDSFSYWMAGNFRKYGGHWGDLPVDAHELIALVAPRPVFVTGGTQDQQADPRGEFMAAVGAGPAYRLLGKAGLNTADMPAADAALVSGDVAFREHAGWHTDLPDWPVFLEYASKYFGAPAAYAAVDEWNGDAFFRRIQPVPRNSGFRMEGYWVWDGSIIKVGDEYHLFAVRWPKGHAFPEDYRLHSEVIRAVSKNPLGPYEFKEVVLGKRDPSFWDATIAHSPNIHKIGDTYVLFYMGSNSRIMMPDGRLPMRRVGYATSKSITGPWVRLDRPIIPTESNNPAVYVDPDGRVKVLYRDTDLRVYIAEAPRFDAPYIVRNDNVWPEARLEDFEMFKAGGKYRFICEDNVGGVTGHERWGTVFVSSDGISGWKPNGRAPAYDHTVRFTDGTALHCERRERPQLLIENGEVTTLVTSVYDGKDTWTQPVPLSPPLPVGN